MEPEPTVLPYKQIRVYLLIVLTFVVMTITAIILAFYLGIQKLGTKQHTAGHLGIGQGLWAIILLGAAAGVIACAAVEFIKKLTPLRRLLNRRAVKKRFPQFERFPRIPRYPPWSENYPPQLVERIIERQQVPALSYASTIEQLAAQIATFLRQQLTTAMGEPAGSAGRLMILWNIVGDPPFLRTRQELADLLEMDEADLGYLERRERQDSDAADRLLHDSLATYIDTEVDLFVIYAKSNWQTVIRLGSTILAGALSALGVATAIHAFSAILIGSLFGAMVGGPVSWLTRDLVRVVERKASY